MTKKKLTRKEKVKRSQLQEQLEKSKAERKYGFWMILWGIVFVLFFGNMWINRNQVISKDELITIEGTVTNKLELKRKKTVGSSMIIRFKEYPEIDFKVGRFSVAGLKLRSLQNNVGIGDKLQVDISRDDNSKIELNKSRTISTYGIRNVELEFLNVRSHNEAKKKNRNSIATYLILGFSFWMLGYGIHLRIKNRMKSAANNG